MNEREALLRAVCENPDEDTPRLVFADWLQEHGEEDRAEFIRVQVELACAGEKPTLKQREKELLAARREEWEQPFRQFEGDGSSRRFIYDVHFRRGFVWGLDVNDEEKWFAKEAPTLFALAPIQRLALFHKWQHADLAECPELLRVKELQIDRAGFEIEELEALFRVKYLANLNRLELIADDDNGHLTPEAVELLTQSKALPSLRHLNLSHNWCEWEGDDSWVETLAKGKLIGQLESLFLRGTLIGDDAPQTLAQCKRLRSLKHLDLSCNYVGEDGARAIATTKNLPNLATLDLRQNIADTDQGISLATRQMLQSRFGEGVLIDGRVDD